MLDKHPIRVRPVLLVALFGLVVVASGCAEVVGAGLRAAVGSDTASGFAGDGAMSGPRVARVTSIYQDAPTPGWDVALRPTPSAARSEYFEARLFDGQCPGMGIGFGRLHDPFGPIEMPSRGWLTVRTSHYQWGGRSVFDPMPLGGVAPQAQSWHTLDMYGMADGGCHPRFLPLLRFGTFTPTVVAK